MSMNVVEGVKHALLLLYTFDFGNLLKIAFKDKELTVEEDLSLVPDMAHGTISHKWKASSDKSPPDSEGLTLCKTATLLTKPPATSSTPADSSFQHSKWRNIKWAKQWREKTQAATPLTQKASDWTCAEHVQLAEVVTDPSGFTACNMSVMNGAYKASKECYDGEAMVRYPMIEDFLEKHPNFHLIEWDGK